MATTTTPPGSVREPHAKGGPVIATHVSPQLAARLLARLTHAPGARAAIDVRTPFTGEVIAQIPRGTREDVEWAVARAREAQAGWSSCSPRERARVFVRFHDLLLERQDEVLDLVQLESGKTRLHAFEEVVDVANVARYYAHHAPALLEPTRRRGLVPFVTVAREFHHPIGTIGFIVPWNYPLNLAVTDAIPALMAGNAVVIKPDHHTTLTALWVIDLLYEAGLPQDVVTVVSGEGPEIGPDLVNGVDYVMFTGSTKTGRVIAQQAGARLIGCALELGGKNPMIVLADADLDAAADGAMRGAFVGAGQVCVSIERIYVDRTVASAFLEKLVAKTGALRLGAALDYSFDMGSLTFEDQLRRVEAHVNDAVEKGAKLVLGGRRREDIGPLFYEPTILTGVTPSMRMYHDETFGPVLAVYEFDVVDQAIERCNDSDFGLNASVYTRDIREGLRLATRIEAGTVNINEAYSATWGSVDAPIGGFKESGLSRRHGREGLLKFTETQTVAVQRFLPLAPLPGMSSATFARTFTKLLKWQRKIPGLR